MTNHIQKNTLSELDSLIFSIEEELVNQTVQHRCEKGNEILFSNCGTIAYTACNGTGELLPGGCLFFRQMDTYTLCGPAGGTTVCRIMINPVLTDDLLYPYEDVDTQLLVLDKQISGLVCRLYEELTMRKPYYEWICRGKLQEIYGYLYRNCRQEETEPICQNTEVVQQILLYIKKNFKQRIHLDKICTEIGYSKYYACHAFKKQTGQSIIGYTNQLRCEYADRLLRSGKISLPVAGTRAGFSGTEQFVKTYEKLYGKCPDTTANL